ncbi:MAG: hypothetical protein GX369_01645 [Euryarchaeota archaeon]|nr:hypothetical protein [Euryarchaeota archaeon]
MGLSISAATAVIFISAVLAFSGIFAVVSNAQDSLIDEHRDYLSRLDDKASTRLTISEILIDTDTISVMNEGTTTLDVREIDLLIDGILSNDRIESTRVNGIEETNIWMPGEMLEISVPEIPIDAKIRIISSNGASAYV